MKTARLTGFDWYNMINVAVFTCISTQPRLRIYVCDFPSVRRA